MAKRSGNSKVPSKDARKLKPELRTHLARLRKTKLEELVEEALVDAYGEEEEIGAFFTMIEEHLVLPFPVTLLGFEAMVEEVDLTDDGRIVAYCRRDGLKQTIDIRDLPLSAPMPEGAEWIAAYKHWRKGF
jgi:hypothetical protein